MTPTPEARHTGCTVCGRNHPPLSPGTSDSDVNPFALCAEAARQNPNPKETTDDPRHPP